MEKDLVERLPVCHRQCPPEVDRKGTCPHTVKLPLAAYPGLKNHLFKAHRQDGVNNKRLPVSTKKTQPGSENIPTLSHHGQSRLRIENDYSMNFLPSI